MNKLLAIALLIVIGGLGIVYLNKDKSNTTSNTQTTQTDTDGVKLVSSQEFAELAKNENAFILDVHTPEQTHIAGTDALIPHNQINENQDKLPSDKNTPILVYCRSGSMSALASNDLVELGYTNVYDLDGGTNAYKEQQISVQLWPEKQELGTVIYGEVETTNFTLTNYTPLPLSITRVSTSCGCTKASVQSNVVGPYESTVVNVSFDPAVHKDDTDLGELTRTIYIETDNPNFPELETIITANVIKEN